jgi:hypothetical protein
MGTTQVEFTASEEEEIIDAEDNVVSDRVPNSLFLPIPYPKGSRELRSLSYEIPKWMTQELNGVQSSNIHVAYINMHIKPEKDK